MPKVKRRGGRPRTIAPRKPSGDVVRSEAHRGPTILLETIQRRRDAVPGIVPPRAPSRGVSAAPEVVLGMLPEAATPIGILKLRGIIDERQYRAAQQFERVWRIWASYVGAAPHTLRCGERDGTSPINEQDASYIEGFSRSTAAYEKMTVHLKACHQSGLVWAVLVSIIMDQVLPPIWLTPTRPEVAVTALRRGLETLADLWGMDKERAA